jgi:hypothetical protein
LTLDSFWRCSHGAAGKSSIRNGRARQHIPIENWKFAGWGRPKEREDLVAETSADGNALAADGTAAAQHGSAGLGLHARPESVYFYTAVAVRLKCALGHGNALLFALKNLRFDSEVKYSKIWPRNPAHSASKRRRAVIHGTCNVSTALLEFEREAHESQNANRDLRDFEQNFAREKCAFEAFKSNLR